MDTPTGDKMHKGFSLIELLIVILIVSVVYFLGFDDFSFEQQKAQPLNPINLKTEIKKSELYEGKATLMCLDQCRTCYLRTDLSSSFETYPHRVDLKNPKAYVLDKNNQLVRMEFGRYDDKEICLMIDFYSNGSSSQLILENEEGTYLLSSFFDTANFFESPEEAKEYLIDKNNRLSDSGAFYR